MNVDCLTCTVDLEQLGDNGAVTKRRSIKDVTLTLGRDEMRDIVLLIDQLNRARQQIILKNVAIFKRFVASGKATITVQGKTQIYISNCPPEKLCLFLKALAVKCGLKRNTASDRQRLYNTQQKVFQEISPLTNKELEDHSTKLKDKTNLKATVDAKGKPTTTPKREAENLSRKRLRCDSSPQPAKAAKKFQAKQLTKEQVEVLEAVRSGLNVFFTGSAGTGKSFLLKKIIGALPPDLTVATASTGVAACQIGGITLHSFAGIGTGAGSVEQCIELASRPAIRRQWKKCKHLIIDEISMVEAQFFDKLEQIARAVRHSNEPFGGIQLICTGDFLQLPPVSKQQSSAARFCFQADSWSRCMQANFELKVVMRQTDQSFINILQHIRVGKCPEEHFAILMATSEKPREQQGIQATRLCTHKKDAADINALRMKELMTRTETFWATDSNTAYSSKLDQCMPVCEQLELRIGAQVMLTKNLDVSRGLVNGARGVVTGFQYEKNKFPTVKFVQGCEIVLKREKFSMKMPGGGGLIIRHQLPLALAWAISIHKSQGLTLDCVEVSLSKVFEHGQAYVALSRAKSLDGLRVIDFEPACVKAHSDVLRFYINLRRSMRKGVTI